jgi:hypothetical protein
MEITVCRRDWIALLALALSLAPVGCTSMRSTLFSYDGCQDCSRVKKHLKGVPTTVEVPTYLQVIVRRSRWGRVDPNGAVVFTPELETREVEIVPKYQKEIFGVDFTRPAAGTLKYNLTFDKDRQYITGIDNHLEDKTIADVTSLIAAILQTIPPVKAPVRAGDGTGATLSQFQDVIATELFAISEPDLQNRIQAFLNTYVNQCHQLCGPCVYPPPPAPCQGCRGSVPIQ